MINFTGNRGAGKSTAAYLEILKANMAGKRLAVLHSSKATLQLALKGFEAFLMREGIRYSTTEFEDVCSVGHQVFIDGGKGELFFVYPREVKCS